MASPSPSPIRAGGATPRHGAPRPDSGKDTPRGREQSHRLQFRPQATPRNGATVLQAPTFVFLHSMITRGLYACGGVIGF